MRTSEIRREWEWIELGGIRCEVCSAAKSNAQSSVFGKCRQTPKGDYLCASHVVSSFKCFD